MEIETVTAELLATAWIGRRLPQKRLLRQTI
jgi:hypothetical protein